MSELARLNLRFEGILSKPSESRLGLELEFPYRISDLSLSSGIGLDVEGNKGLAVSAHIHAQYKYNALLPRFSIFSSGPLNRDSLAYNRCGAALDWELIRTDDILVRGGIALSTTAVRTNEPSLNIRHDLIATFTISHASEIENTAIPAIINYPGGEAFKETSLTIKRSDIGLEKMPESRPKKRLIIFIDSKMYEELQRTNPDIFNQYLAGIAKDYEELEGYNLSFEVRIGNWEEAIPAFFADRNSQKVKFIQDMQRAIQDHDNGSLIGILNFGNVPYLEIQDTSNSSVGGPSDYAYHFPYIDISKADSTTGVFLYDKKSSPTQERYFPVGRFPADNSNGTGCRLAIRLMENAIAYRKGLDPHTNQPESSSETFAYLSEIAQRAHDSNLPTPFPEDYEHLSEVVSGRQRPDLELGTIFSHINLVEPLNIDYGDIRRQILEALSGSGNKAPAHAVYIKDHGNSDRFLVTDSPHSIYEWIGTYFNRKYSEIEASDMENYSVGSNFVHMLSCNIALGVHSDDGLLHNILENSSAVGIAVYNGAHYSSLSEQSQTLALIDLELRLPQNFPLRASESAFFSPVMSTNLNQIYFGDPFVRYLPNAYDSTIHTASDLPESPSKLIYSTHYLYRIMDLMYKATQSDNLDAVLTLLPKFEKYFYPHESNAMEFNQHLSISSSYKHNEREHSLYEQSKINFFLEVHVRPYLEGKGMVL